MFEGERIVAERIVGMLTATKLVRDDVGAQSHRILAARAHKASKSTLFAASEIRNELLKTAAKVSFGRCHTAVATPCCFQGGGKLFNYFSYLSTEKGAASAWHLRHIRSKKHQLRRIPSSP